jgi:CheY-like chemotaxis protein
LTREGEFFPSLKTRRFFTVAESARLLGISIPCIHSWIRKGQIPRLPRVSKRGGYRVPRALIVRLLRFAGREVPGLWAPRRTTVLLIEDDRAVRELVVAAFQNPRWGVRVEVAETPEDGLLLAAKVHPDVILLDTFTPAAGMTSDQALGILRRSRMLRRVKVIRLASQTAAREGSLSPKAERFLPKPFGLPELREAVLGRPPRKGSAPGKADGSDIDRRRWEFRAPHRPRLEKAHLE